MIRNYNERLSPPPPENIQSGQAGLGDLRLKTGIWFSLRPGVLGRPYSNPTPNPFSNLKGLKLDKKVSKK